MKRLFAILLCLPAVCLGSEYDDKYNKLKNDSTFSPLMAYEELVKHSLPVIEERVRNIDSELVESAKNDTDEQKIVKYNNRLAQKVFDDYKKRFLSDLEQKSKQTARKIKEEKNPFSDNGTHTWLDRGMLDTEQCNGGTYTAKNDSEKEIEKARRDTMGHTCLYPDGFETYEMYFADDESMPGLYVEMDDKSKNVTEVYFVDLYRTVNADNPNDVGYHLMLDVSNLTYNYTENHIFRNAIQQDIKDGYMNEPIQCQGQKCDELEKTTVDETIDIFREGAKSQDIPIPSPYVTSMGIDRSFSYNKAREKLEKRREKFKKKKQ